MQGKLSESLKDKLSSFNENVNSPYVWRLLLSEADFIELQSYLESIAATDGKKVLENADYAILVIVYIAEWYKRCYCSGNKCDLIDGLYLENVWTNSRINKELYLYKDENGSNRWLYSIYVLGGLAIRHELQRNDRLSFLKGLCRIFHGEDLMLDKIDDTPERAIAFRESIKKEHSLYEYMREILNGRMPFNKDDLNDSESDVNRFVAMIKSANDEVLKEKFRLEWLVSFPPDGIYMNRELIVWLKPEKVGGGLHQYLLYDRVHQWGVPNADRQEHLRIYIRFNCDRNVGPLTMGNPIITYLNNSMDSFVACGVEKCVKVNHVPTCRFDSVDIVVRDDDNNEYIAQSHSMAEYMQLWKQDDYSDSWTSDKNSQRRTALLFSNRCRLEEKTSKIYRRPFQDRRFVTGESWNWIEIHESVSIYDEGNNKRCFYNRMGSVQITTKLYDNIIQYIDDGCVEHHYMDPDVSDDYETEMFPLIFGKEDVVVRHFATEGDTRKDGIEENAAELIEYKQRNGRYAEWTASDSPPYGEVTLRITVKDEESLHKVIFLPRLDENFPIKRDFEKKLIRYRDLDGNEATPGDKITSDDKVLSPTIPIQYGEGESYYVVNVYQPTLVKEIIFDDKIVWRMDRSGDKFCLPYIFKNRVKINDFSEAGYQTYECRNLGNIYTKDFIKIAGNLSVGDAAMNAWRDGRQYKGTSLDEDEMAPDCLVVFFGNCQKGSTWEGVTALFWNYDKDTEPTPIDPDQIEAGSMGVGVVFQDIRNSTEPDCNLGPDLDNDPWSEEWDEIKVSYLKCFEVANKYGIYFFLLRPLRELKKEKVKEEIYEPLLEERAGKLTPEDRCGLLRFAKESGFDWSELNIEIDN